MLKKISLIVVLGVISLSSLFAQRIEILGAGATFPYPLYSKMFDEYSKTGNRVNYQAIGSGGGINQLIAKTTDFGGTDAIVKPDVEEKAGDTIIHIPTCLGAVVVTYNLQIAGNVSLKFTSDLISEIFLGKIKNWNDKKIQAVNPGVKLPNLPITVVYRSDGSGTTYIFTEYLEKTSKEWADKVGHGTAVKWPVGIGSRGNPGVAGTVSQTPGAIGYVELIYAMSNNMPYGDVKNKTGKFITPTMDAVSYAADTAIPADTKVSLVDTDAEKGYPISSFTWVIVYKEQNYNNRSLEQAKATLELIKWMITDGQTFAPALHYAPLADAAQKRGLDQLKSITYNGKPILN